MRRLMSLMLAPAFLLIISFITVVLLVFVVNEIKSSRHGTVTLKAKDKVPAEQLDGDIIRGDKYVTVKVGGVEKIYTWDQIENISYKEEASLQKLDRIVDLLDLLSKLGIGVTVILIMVGLQQYGKSQTWEREKFLAGAVKEFVDLQRARNAMQMLDSLALYRDGRQIEFNPNANKPEERKTFVSNEKIFAALTTTPHDDLAKDDDLAMTIRDCFDTFLSYMDTFNHYIDQDLITKDALMSHVGYWIELLGPEGKLDSRYKQRVLQYARQYGLDAIESLIQKYQQPSRWERIVNWFIK